MEQDPYKEKLSPEAYRVLRACGTEAPFSGAYWNHHEDGTYRCGACGAALFSSKTKFDSGSGWPSFTEPMDRAHVDLVSDDTLGMRRTEVKCKSCGSHLGHVFPDGPPDRGGERFCINSAALDFKPQE